MEAQKFVKLLKKHRYTLIGVPVLMVCITLVLVRKLPNDYLSKSSISAGLVVDQSQQLVISERANLQETKTNQAFSNLLQMMQMRNVVDQVSYKLIIHDLEEKEPYKKPSKLVGYLNPSARSHALYVYKELYAKMLALNMEDRDQKGLYEVMESMGYDYTSLMKKLKVYRIDNSDFINVEFESENPDLSAYVVNTLCNEFINYYSLRSNDNETKSLNMLKAMLDEKKDSLSNSMRALKEYKINSGVLDLEEQSKSLYAQLSDFDTRIQLAKKEIASNEGALRSLESKVRPGDKEYLDEYSATINKEIINSKQYLNQLVAEFVKTNDNRYKARIDSVREYIGRHVIQASDARFNNPQSVRENMLMQKLTLEVNLELAKNSVDALTREYVKLTEKFQKLVPAEAVIQAREGDISVASQEYLEILKKYNQSSLESNSSIRLRVVESALPGEKQPSKKIVLVALSGLASFVLCLIVLFVLFYMDSSIKSAAELADKTRIAVLGFLPRLKNMYEFDLKELTDPNASDPQIQEYKRQLRSLRYEIDNVIKEPVVLTITSLGTGEGKTFAAYSLAMALLLVKKKVLLIDGNFNEPAITRFSEPGEYVEDYLTGLSYAPAVKEGDLTILGNSGNDISLFEIADEPVVKKKLDALKKNFDFIIVESPAFNALNKAKEWCNVSDNVVLIFEAGKSFSMSERRYLNYFRNMGSKFVGWILTKASDEEPVYVAKRKKASGPELKK